jgi:hypothetical protein
MLDIIEVSQFECVAKAMRSRQIALIFCCFDRNPPQAESAKTSLEIISDWNTVFIWRRDRLAIARCLASSIADHAQSKHIQRVRKN